jgi:hypothetical protein
MNPLQQRRATIAELACDGLTAADLAEIANGPIMDSNQLYLPAGKISLAETEARERAAVEIIRGDD